MPLPDSRRPSELITRYGPTGTGAPKATRAARLQMDVITAVGDAAWAAFHRLGAHRWREGYETDLERGWSRYRGSRCAICDEPWEGW